MKQLQPAGDAQSEPDNDRESVYTWAPVSKPQVPSALRLVVPPELAAYDRELGFRFLKPGDEVSEGSLWQSRQAANKKKQEWTLRAQRSYVEHISGLASAYEWSVRRELAWVGSRLEAAFNLPAESLDEAIRLAIACHDIGKLSVGWQRWAHATQQALYSAKGDPRYIVAPGREFLAKTDGLPGRNGWQEERDIQSTLNIKRPPHACAGVIASCQLIGSRLLRRVSEQDSAGALALSIAALSAIARHHAPTATTYDAVEYAPAARQALADAFTACGLSTDDMASLDLSPQSKGEVNAQMLVSPNEATIANLTTTWLGFVLVRALRLCDQRAERDW